MAKKLTQWRKQGQTATSVDYDASTVDYDSSTTPYASSQTAESTVKKRTGWNKAVKRVVKFIKNPASDTNATIYDSNNIYDSTTLTYDSIVVGEPASTSKKPTDWRTA